jgi:hypothetical protein
MSPKQRRAVRAAWRIPLAATVMLIAGVAVATGAVQRRAMVTISPQARGSATARCKRGQVALAAGFAVPGSDTSNGPVARLDSIPAGRRGVKTTAMNFNQANSGELDSYVYCGTRARPPKVRSKSIQLTPNTFDSVVARCPHGSQAIAGGFGTDQTVITLVSKRTGRRGWKVGGFDIANSGSGPASLTAYAYCKAPGPKIVTKSKDATVTGGLKTLNVKCPKHGKALSGGFDGHFTLTGGQMISAGGALTSKRAAHGRGWTTSAISASSPNQATITTYAYCRR